MSTTTHWQPADPAAVARARARVPGAVEPAGCCLPCRTVAADARALREADAAEAFYEAQRRRVAASAIRARQRAEDRRPRRLI